MSRDYSAKLYKLKVLIMTLADDLKASNAALLSKVEQLEGSVSGLNDKVNNLIVVANTTKDALVALQGQSTISAADVQAVIDAQTAALAGLDASNAAVASESAAVDSAATTVAP